MRWLTYSYNRSTVSIHVNSNEDPINLNMSKANKKNLIIKYSSWIFMILQEYIVQNR